MGIEAMSTEGIALAAHAPSVGAAGAMQRFGDRSTRDRILHVTAHVRALKRVRGSAGS